MKNNPRNALNKKEEVFRQCLHRQKHFLGFLFSQELSSIETPDINRENDQNLITEEAEETTTKEDHNFYPNNSNTPEGTLETNQNINEIAFGSTRSGRKWRTKEKIVKS